MGRRLADGAGGADGTLAGALAMALVAANSATWIEGQHVTTDLPFAALAAAALLAALAWIEKPGLAAALAAGLSFGGAAAIRGNALLLLPGLLAAWSIGRRAAPSPRRFGELALAVLCATALLVPNWLLREQVFGDPFHDENWKNLAWKLHGYPDWARFTAIADGGGFFAILASEPGAVVAGAFRELLQLAKSGLAELLGSRVHALAALAGAWLCVRARGSGRRPADALWLLASVALFTAGVATAFFAWGRFLLVALPVVAALTAAGALSLARSARTRLAAAAAVALLAGWSGAKSVLWRLPWFVANHPVAEVAALRRLDARPLRRDARRDLAVPRPLPRARLLRDRGRLGHAGARRSGLRRAADRGAPRARRGVARGRGGGAARSPARAARRRGRAGRARARGKRRRPRRLAGAARSVTPRAARHFSRNPCTADVTAPKSLRAVTRQR